MEIKVNMEKRHFLKRWMQGMGFAFLLMGMAACTSEEEEISDRNRDAILGTWRQQRCVRDGFGGGNYGEYDLLDIRAGGAPR